MFSDIIRLATGNRVFCRQLYRTGKLNGCTRLVDKVKTAQTGKLFVPGTGAQRIRRIRSNSGIIAFASV